MDTNTYLDTFENKLYEELVKLCGSYIVIDGLMPSSQDIEEHWKELAPEYLHDAIPQISDYPTVSIAWAGYLGIAVANDWDSNWELLRNRPYKEFYGVQGFDDMDENIVYNILGLAPSSKEAADIEAMKNQHVSDMLSSFYPMMIRVSSSLLRFQYCFRESGLLTVSFAFCSWSTTYPS